MEKNHVIAGTNWIALALIALATGCSEAQAASCPSSSEWDAKAPERVMRTLFEVATQVTAAELANRIRLDGAQPVEGVGSALLLNSQLVEGGELVEEAFPPHVEGGSVVGTMHGMCTHLGGGLSLEPAGTPGRVAKCEQALNVHEHGQIIVSGLIQQEAFEAGVTQTLAVTGGTGEYQGAHGQLKITQLTFPGIVKKLELTMQVP